MVKRQRECRTAVCSLWMRRGEVGLYLSQKEGRGSRYQGKTEKVGEQEVARQRHSDSIAMRSLCVECVRSAGRA